MNVTYANCYLGPLPAGDLLITDERAVAASVAGVNAVIGDGLIDPDVAEAHNVALWRLAYGWFTVGGEDPTLSEGVSAGDLAGAELAQTVLLPAARAALACAAIDFGTSPAVLTTVVAEGGPGHYGRVEAVQCEAFAAAMRHRFGNGLERRRVVARDPRNARLFGKYRLTRDPEWLQSLSGPGRVVLDGALRAVNAVALLRGPRGRPTLVVDEFSASRAFARRYVATPDRRYRLARSTLLRDELSEVLRAGDLALIPFTPTAGTRDPQVAGRVRAFAAAHGEALASSFTIAGVEMWPAIEPHVIELVERYSAFVAGAAPACARQLERLKPVAVLVPFDAPPVARLLVRVAQRLRIPTFVINDGFKADDFESDCMTADHALAWSAAIAEHYLSRRDHGRTTVTGNPKADARSLLRVRPAARGPVGRILVGGFAFSPVDINCRRSDPESFLDQVLDGIERSAAAGARVTIKLHPADEAEHYTEALAAHPGLSVELVSSGDIAEMFGEADVYVTGPSTSLLEAVAAGTPVIYYRVNSQKLHPPYRDDPFIAARTASSPGELADALGRELVPTDERHIFEWCERYLGPRDGGSVVRIIDTIEREVASRADG